jgi:hypothetical protein
MTHPTPPPGAPKPPAWLKLAAVLKAISILAFPVAVIAAAVMQRSVLLLGGFALVMVLIGAIQRNATAAALGQPAEISLARLITGFALRFGAMVGLFIVLVGIFALFRETTLARGLAQIDALLVIIPAAIALGADLLSRRIFGTHVQAASESLQAAMNQAAGRAPNTGNASEDGEIIEGEVIAPKPGED